MLDLFGGSGSTLIGCEHDGTSRVPDGTGPVVLRRDRPALGTVRGEEGEAGREETPGKSLT